MIWNKKFTWIKCPVKKQAKLDKSVKTGHYYFTPDGKYYESITTKLGKLKDKTFLKNWENKVTPQVARYIRITSAEYGTKTHKLCEYYVKNKQYPFKKPLLPKAHFDNLKESIDLCDNLIASEFSIWNDKLKLAGTIDLIGDFANRFAIIDFKTSKKPKRKEWIDDYFYQGAFYAYSWKLLTGILPENIVILVSCETGDLQIFTEDSKIWIKKLKRKLKEENKP